MKEFHLERQYEHNRQGKFLNDSDYDHVISETTRVYKPDGTPFLVFMKNAVETETIKKYWPILREVNLETQNRFTSSGKKATLKVRLDGVISNTHVLEEPVMSGIIGYFDRYARTPFCRKCAWNLKEPEKFNLVNPLFAQISNAYRRGWPEKWLFQETFYERTNPDFRIPNTVFTTITVNKNYRTGCHKDPKNLDGAVSAMLYIRQGQLSGGYLVLPTWRVALKMDTGDLAIFDATNEWHGNTDIIPISKDYQRCTLVCYFRSGMVHCGSAMEECERAKRRKQGEPLI